jgi:hypothetical protein
MTARETAENIAKTIDSMAEEIAKRSVPSSDESFREWSSHRLHERIKTHACSLILDYLLRDFQPAPSSTGFTVFEPSMGGKWLMAPQAATGPR